MWFVIDKSFKARKFEKHLPLMLQTDRRVDEKITAWDENQPMVGQMGPGIEVMETSLQDGVLKLLYAACPRWLELSTGTTQTRYIQSKTRS